jgi:hypothetical protein
VSLSRYQFSSLPKKPYCHRNPYLLHLQNPPPPLPEEETTLCAVVVVVHHCHGQHNLIIKFSSTATAALQFQTRPPEA